MSSPAPQNNGNELPLPFGWVKEYDPSSEHYFYVDTKANPPRSIWTHPYEDEQYLNEHPDVKEKVQSMLRQMEADRARDDLSSPPAYMPERRHSYTGRDNDDMGSSSNGSAAVLGAGPAANKGKGKEKKRGVFGKMKDNLIGTAEERAAYKKEMERVKAEERKQREAAYQKQLEAQRVYYQQQAAQRQQYAQAGPSRVYVQQGYGGYGGGYGGYGGGYGQPRYGPPPMPYNQRYNNGGGFGGGSNVGLGLLGGLAGGLLLGDLLF
ncbi:unnamed protein product [Peniophora sp. CBMAI 1063]|nr:unnamed protein product [Peniophora sp. CBMAI 1063]